MPDDKKDSFKQSLNNILDGLIDSIMGQVKDQSLTMLYKNYVEDIQISLFFLLNLIIEVCYFSITLVK